MTDWLPANLDYGVFDVAVADIDGDDCLDIILGNLEQVITDETGPTPVFVFRSQNAVLRQSEPGKFIDETSDRLPGGPNFGVSTSSFDTDGDGDFEIFVSNGDGRGGLAQDRLLENLTKLPVSISPSPARNLAGFGLAQNYPNPFNPETMVEYSLPAAGEVTITIFDGLGRQVRTLLRAVQSHGRHQAVWDGRNDEGAAVASGVYFYKLQTQSRTVTRRMVLQR